GEGGGAEGGGHRDVGRRGNVAGLSARALRTGCACGRGHAPLDPGHRHAASLGNGARARARCDRNTRRVAVAMNTLLPAAAVIVFLCYLGFCVSGVCAAPLTMSVLAHLLTPPFRPSLPAPLPRRFGAA